MKSKNEYFLEKKPLYVIVIPFIVILVVLFLFMIASINNNKGLVIFFISNITLFLFLLLLFYQFKIIVTSDKLIISFGVGWIKKKIPLSEIDLTSFSDKKISWFYGAGWRYDLKGNVLFNASPGTALTFKLKNATNRIMIVSKNRALLKEAIIKACQSA